MNIASDIAFVLKARYGAPLSMAMVVARFLYHFVRG